MYVEKHVTLSQGQVNSLHLYTLLGLSNRKEKRTGRIKYENTWIYFAGWPNLRYKDFTISVTPI